LSRMRGNVHVRYLRGGRPQKCAALTRPSLSRLRDGTHLLAVGPVKPRPLAQAGQIGRLRRRVPEPGTRPTWPQQDSQARRQPTSRSDRVPGPTLRPDHSRTTEAGLCRTQLHPPCRFRVQGDQLVEARGRSQITQFGMPQPLEAGRLGWHEHSCVDLPFKVSLSPTKCERERS